MEPTHLNSAVMPIDALVVGANSSGAAASRPAPRAGADLAQRLRRYLGTCPHVFDVESGEQQFGSPDQPARDWSCLSALLAQVARRGQPLVVEHEEPLATIAIPWKTDQGRWLVATTMFVTRELHGEADLRAAADRLELDGSELVSWAVRQSPQSVASMERMATLVCEHRAAELRVRAMESESQQLSGSVANTLEEISLIYRITSNLKISSRPDELVRMAQQWMAEVIPAESFACLLIPPENDESNSKLVAEPEWITCGRCPISSEEFTQLQLSLEPQRGRRLVVCNGNVTGSPDWKFPAVRNLILTPLAEGERVFGWLAAINHRQRSEFGTVEANLLASVSAILSVHSSNMDLYRQQADLLASVVRAMSSAIDAKDPYTRGHSDRVARVAVRIAQELGCDEDTLQWLFLSGLLHDVGKIGIDDNVLRKPGKLTDAEYEHIKSHVEIGYRILRDLHKMKHVLPVVLHHHESWDGKGYPFGLLGENIPFLARIVAVADAYDAMSSDRPYRKGMGDEKLDSILRAGRGSQWDPDVIDAFFRVREDIREISRRGGDGVETGQIEWN